MTSARVPSAWTSPSGALSNRQEAIVRPLTADSSLNANRTNTVSWLTFIFLVTVTGSNASAFSP